MTIDELVLQKDYQIFLDKITTFPTVIWGTYLFYEITKLPYLNRISDKPNKYIVAYLLNKNVDPNSYISPAYIYTPTLFMHGLRTLNIDIIESFVSHGAFMTTIKGVSPVVLLTEEYYVRKSRFLENDSIGVPLVDVDVDVNANIYSPQDIFAIIQLLIKKGADIHEKSLWYIEGGYSAPETKSCSELVIEYFPPKDELYKYIYNLNEWQQQNNKNLSMIIENHHIPTDCYRHIKKMLI